METVVFMDNENVVYLYSRIFIAINKNEITKFTGNYIGLKAIILNEVPQAQKDKCHVFLSFVNINFEYLDMCFIWKYQKKSENY